MKTQVKELNQKFVEGGFYLFKTTSRIEVYFIVKKNPYDYTCRLYDRNGELIMKDRWSLEFFRYYGSQMKRVKPKTPEHLTCDINWANLSTTERG
jgi:hypothetical protein